MAPRRPPTAAAARPSAPRTIVRDPERVRRRVLAAATRLFTARGFAGTSFRDVSTVCGVSVSLIQHHFGTKRSLYAAVKEHAVASYVKAQTGPAAQARFDLDSRDGLRALARFFEGGPEWSRLAAWSALEGDHSTWPGEDDYLDRVADVIRERQAAGRVRADVDPELLLIAVGGLMRAWVTQRRRHAARLAHLGTPEAQEQRYLSLCAALLGPLSSTHRSTQRKGY
jgi:AcrR family transcriptional regulator